MNKKQIKIIKNLIIDEFQTSDNILFYYYLLSKFKKPIIYNWSTQRIASGTGIHENKVRKHLRFLKNHDMIKVSGKNLLILNPRKFAEYQGIKKHKEFKINVYKSLSFKDFKAYIIGFLIKLNIQTQEFLISIKDPKTHKQGKLRKKFVKKNGHQAIEGSVREVNNSIRGLAKYFKKSNYFIQYWLKILKDKNIIKTSLNLKIFKVKKYFNSIHERYIFISRVFLLNNKYFRYIDNDFYEVVGTKIEFKIKY